MGLVFILADGCYVWLLSTPDSSFVIMFLINLKS